MQITRIDLEGKTGHYATAQRRAGGGKTQALVVVTILTPDQPNGREHHALADCKADLWSMAECLQYHLDGCHGTNSMIHDYYREVLRLSDL